MHGVAASTLAATGGATAERLLGSMAEGKLGALAFRERATGANFYDPSLNAEHTDGHVRVSGRKRFVKPPPERLTTTCCSWPLERHLRDARAGALMAPRNTILRSWIGKKLAGLPVP
jgi:alkylation response protein AidB-like acyl-CoA dehydrogenase